MLNLFREALRHMFGSPAPARRRSSRRHAVAAEVLEERIVPAVTASFSAQFGQLTIIGDQADNVINVSRGDDGQILINNGQVAVVGGSPTVENTNTILALGLGGNDQITLNEFNGSLPSAYLLGGSGNDLLIGGAGQDYLSGSTGNDTIRGGGNDDQIFGGSGNDVLLGDRGNDRVEGQDGSDLLIWNNGDGSDFLEGGAGNDFVQVNGANGAGDDFSIDPNGERVRFQRNNLGLFTLDIGTTENLDVNGQGGSDVIIGSVGLNGLISLDLDGGEGNDLLIGGDGVDVLRGGAGNDTLLGNRGNDVVLGQDGNDLLIVNNGDGSDFLEGGADIDTVQVNGSNTAGDVILITPNGNRVQVARTNLDQFTLDIGSTETIDINTLAGNDSVTGSVGLAGLTTLDIDGGLGFDILTGGDGDDRLNGGGDADLLRGRDGNDVLIGNQGNDFVYGENGNDLIIVNEGDGSDLIEGGLGRDTVQITTGNLDDNVVLDGFGRVVRVERTNENREFTQSVGSSEVLDIQTNGGNDNVVLNPLETVDDLQTIQVDLGDGDDVINATDLDAVFTLIGRGGDGDDILFGGAGNDVLLGEDGRDIIIANDGNDFVSGGEGNDILISGDGNDVLLGADGNDVLSGGRGNDILLGGEGNDVLNGGADIDFIDGGLGQDSAINGETVINVP